MDRLLPGTVVGSKNLSGLTLPQARDVIVGMTKADRLEIVVSGKTFDYTPQQLGVSYDVDSTLQAAYSGGRDDWWRLGTRPSTPLDYSVDTPVLTAAMAQLASQVGTSPVDAAIVVNNGQPVTVPEQSGQTVDRAALARLIRQSVGTGAPTRLAVAPRVQLADVKVAELGPAVTAAKQLMATQIVFSYNGQTFSPTTVDIGKWLTFVKTTKDGTVTLMPQLDRAQVASYIQKIAGRVNVAPVSQMVTNKDGVSTVDRPGANGTAIDQDPAVAAIMAAVPAGQALNFTITDHVVPFLTIATNFSTLPYAKYIEVNLSKQHLWVWQDGAIIYDSPVTSGATGAGFPTATGLFSIYYKTTNTHLVGTAYGPRYNYDVFVQYWMPFYSGFGLHDASWRNGNFGGQDYYYGGSHGCVNLPLATAAFLYNWSDIGTPVWVHN